MPTYNNTSANNYKTPSGLLKAGATGFQTTDILDHLDGVIRSSDSPAFNLLRDRHNLTFTGAGQVSVSFSAPQLLKSILLTATVDLDMYINLATNTPPKRLLAGKEYWLSTGQKVEGLFFDHLADGSLIVEEVGPVSEATTEQGGITFGGESVTFGGEGVTW